MDFFFHILGEGLIYKKKKLFPLLRTLCTESIVGEASLTLSISFCSKTLHTDKQVFIMDGQLEQENIGQTHVVTAH